jgi:pentatricopeptide repeat protein
MIENMLLKAYLDDGKIMIAKRLFKDLDNEAPLHSFKKGNHACRPRRNRETYRIMIEGLRRLGKDELAEEYSKLMLEQGDDLSVLI